MHKNLVSRDSKGKLRVAYIDCEWSDEQHAFIIHRVTGLYGGKQTPQAEITVSKGKAKRTISEQALLQFNAKVKEYKDKGYKEINGSADNYTEAELYEIVGSEITSSDGVVKPMLAKQADDITNEKIFTYNYYASRKIDGLRVEIYKGKDGKLHTASRGAMNYDAALVEILTNETLIDIFNKNPNLIMDGECYKHGMSLQQINSVARTQVTANDYSILQFYWYDIVDTNRTFAGRLSIIMDIAEKYHLGFSPEAVFAPGDLRIQVVPQVYVSGYIPIMRLHDEYVEEGWEGVVIRRAESLYRPNGRTNDMIKIKRYKDSEFRITGYELGLRGSEDMVFELVTEDGVIFKAKPHGDRLLKQWYVNNFDEECLNHYATVKYFYLSDDGVPLQPSVKSIRLKEDM